MKRWIEVVARFDEPPADWSLFADAFDRHGCDSSLIAPDERGISGYLQEVSGASQRAEALGRELIRLGAGRFEVSQVEDQDWSEVWKKHFKPKRIGERFVVVPSWEDFDAQRDDIILKLDPGQAFGTGEHPTTELCLRLLEATFAPESTILDLGCGSGILAIAAAKLGGKVTATDIDEGAVEIARENAARNAVKLELYAGDGFGEWSAGRTWDGVLSNIISATLIRLAPEAAGYVAPGGAWIVSGVLNSNWADVRKTAQACGFVVERVEELDDWVGARFRRLS